MTAWAELADTDQWWCWAVVAAGALALAGVAVTRWWLLRRRGDSRSPLDWSRDTEGMLDDLVQRTQVRWHAAVEADPPEPEAVRRQRETLALERAQRDNPDTVATIRGWPATGTSVPIPLGWSNFGPGPGVGPGGQPGKAGKHGGRPGRPREAATQY